LVDYGSTIIGGCVKKFNHEYNNELIKGDKIIKVEFPRSNACVLNWRLCKSGEGILSWVYASFDEINFSSKIESNRVLAIEMEEECKSNFT
jgi:hypothetical protein